MTVDLLGTGRAARRRATPTISAACSARRSRTSSAPAYADTLLGNGLDNILDPNISGRQVVETVDGRGNAHVGDILGNLVNYSSFDADRGEGVVGGFATGSANGGTLTRQNAGGAGQLDQVNFTNIERLYLTGTSKADTVFGGQSADRIYTNGGDDVVIAGRGADDVHTDTGNDRVAWGTNLAGKLDFGGAPSPSPASFHLDGGRGLDTLSIDLSFTSQDLRLIGQSTATEYRGTNFTLSNGAAAENFEYLGDVRTGGGDDFVVQLGEHDNRFETGDGEDIIISGLGFDQRGRRSRPGRDLDPDYGPDDDFADAAGDRLLLDYSSLGSTEAVRSSSFLVDDRPRRRRQHTVHQQGHLLSPSMPRRANARTTSVDFTGIEGLTVVGSQGDDVLNGTNTVFSDLGTIRPLRREPRRRRPAFGGAATTSCSAEPATTRSRAATAATTWVEGNSERRHLRGLHRGRHSDGRRRRGPVRSRRRLGSFYNDGRTNSPALNYAVITDFDASEGDTISLHDGEDYRVEFVGNDASSTSHMTDGYGVGLWRRRQ